MQGGFREKDGWTYGWRVPEKKRRFGFEAPRRFSDRLPQLQAEMVYQLGNGSVLHENRTALF